MPKKSIVTFLRLNLLKPQSNPEKIYSKLIGWLLSTGRYIIVFVELLVLLAFLSRFKFDADLASTKEATDQQIPFIESQKEDEQLIRQTQIKLATVKNIKLTNPNYADLLKRVSDQTPENIKLSNITMEKQPGKVNIKISGNVQSNNDLSVLILGLKSDSHFSEINLVNIGLEQGIINFTISGSASIKVAGEKKI